MMVESEGLAATFQSPGRQRFGRQSARADADRQRQYRDRLLTKLAGGPAAATAWVRGQGIEGLRVDRDTAGLFRDFYHIGPGPFPGRARGGRQGRSEARGKGQTSRPPIRR